MKGTGEVGDFTKGKVCTIEIGKENPKNPNDRTAKGN